MPRSTTGKIVRSELEALLQFLYQSPVGLVQTDAEGDITLINPMAAQLLMPLAPGGQLGNLLDVLDPVAPQLRTMLSDNGGAPGPVCEALRIHLPLPNRHTNGHATRAQPSANTLEALMFLGMTNTTATTYSGNVSFSAVASETGAVVTVTKKVDTTPPPTPVLVPAAQWQSPTMTIIKEGNEEADTYIVGFESQIDGKIAALKKCCI